jgi:GcrA cell cycle regulator
MNWTAENDDKLKSLWNAGLSALQIAERMGRTRMAVMGRKNRLKLPVRLQDIRKRSSRPRRVRKVDRVALSSAIGFVQRLAHSLRNGEAAKPKQPAPPTQPPHQAEPASAPTPLMIGFLDLKEDTCRWPINDPRSPEFGFCGIREADNPVEPYCKYHRGVARAAR